MINGSNATAFLAITNADNLCVYADDLWLEIPFTTFAAMSIDEAMPAHVAMQWAVKLRALANRLDEEARKNDQ